MLKEVKALKKSDVGRKVDERLQQFSTLGKKGDREWFSELCFCILTSNSKSSTACAIQRELGPEGFLTKRRDALIRTIKRNKHRFHNTKAGYIMEARKHKNIRSTLLPIIEEEGLPTAREWLVKNVKGLGYKEASHFLRNVGHLDVAILDRHILNLMVEHGYLEEKPKTLTKRSYHDIEKRFLSLTKKAGMSPGELDMYMWYLKAGDVLK